MPAGGSAEQADVNSSLNAVKILSCKTDKEKKGMKKERKKEKDEKNGAWSPHVPVRHSMGTEGTGPQTAG